MPKVFGRCRSGEKKTLMREKPREQKKKKKQGSPRFGISQNLIQPKRASGLIIFTVFPSDECYGPGLFQQQYRHELKRSVHIFCWEDISAIMALPTGKYSKMLGAATPLASQPLDFYSPYLRGHLDRGRRPGPAEPLPPLAFAGACQYPGWWK